MIETHKIVTGKYDTSIAQTYVTRENELQLTKNRSVCDFCKYYFTSRIVYIWNSPPNSVVTANTTNMF